MIALLTPTRWARIFYCWCDLPTDGILVAAVSYYLVCGFWIFGLLWFEPDVLCSRCTACSVSGSVIQSRGLVSQETQADCLLWPTRAWVGDISCPSLIKLPRVAVFESDTGKLAKDQGHSRSTPALMWQGEKFAFIRPCVMRPGEGMGRLLWRAPWMSGGNTLPCCHFRLICLTKRS